MAKKLVGALVLALTLQVSGCFANDACPCGDDTAKGECVKDVAACELLQDGFDWLSFTEGSITAVAIAATPVIYVIKQLKDEINKIKNDPEKKVELEKIKTEIEKDLLGEVNKVVKKSGRKIKPIREYVKARYEEAVEKLEKIVAALADLTQDDSAQVTEEPQADIADDSDMEIEAPAPVVEDVDPDTQAYDDTQDDQDTQGDVTHLATVS